MTSSHTFDPSFLVLPIPTAAQALRLVVKTALHHEVVGETAVPLHPFNDGSARRENEGSDVKSEMIEYALGRRVAVVHVDVVPTFVRLMDG